VTLGFVLLVVNGRARALVVVFGALLVFQSSAELNAPKLLYLAAVAVCVGAALFRLPLLTTTRAYHDLRPLLRSSAVMVALIVFSFFVARSNDVLVTAWLRDVAPYLMVAVAPLFALDAQASFSPRALRRLLVLAGLLGALGFATRWLTNRGIADLGFIPVGLPTLLLASTVFSYGFSSLLHGTRRRIAWIVLTSVVFAMLLSTGTRTTFVLLGAPLAIVFGSRKRLGQRALRLAVAVPLAAIVVFASAQALLTLTDADRAALTKRMEVFQSTGDRTSDRSYLDRVSQNEAAWELFRDSPLVGIGPGRTIPWNNSFGVRQENPTIDSPLSYPAKFGLVGLASTLVFVAAFAATLRRFNRRTGEATVAQLALIGFAAVVAGWSLLQNPYEDKGFSIALIVLLAVASRAAADSDEDRTATAIRP
jgi:O-antigen ligase